MSIYDLMLDPLFDLEKYIEIKDKEIEKLNNIINEIFEWMQNKYDNSDFTGFTVSFQELQDLKELKEEDLNNEVEIIEEEPRNIEICGRFFTKSEYDKLICNKEEKKIPEKLETYRDRNNEIFLDDLCYKYMPIHKDSLSFNEQVIVGEINAIIDYLKSKGE